MGAARSFGTCRGLRLFRRHEPDSLPGAVRIEGGELVPVLHPVQQIRGGQEGAAGDSGQEKVEGIVIAVLEETAGEQAAGMGAAVQRLGQILEGGLQG